MNRKAIFDAVKRLMGRGMTQADVVALDAAIDASQKPDAPSEPEKPVMPGRIGPEGLSLIKQFEGCAKRRADGRIEAYPDPAPGNRGLPVTIGWGSTKGADGKNIMLGTTMTQGEVDALLERDMARYAADVVKVLGNALRATSQRQFDALVSFHYNTGAIGSATLTRKHIAGDFAGAAAEFARWNKAGGKVLAGLTRRRAAEADLYRKGSA